MELPLIAIDTVWHVGSLEPESRTARASLEGPCLSVSVDPEDWGMIARIAGDTWTLERPGALWVDACNLSDLQEAALMDWATGAGLALAAPLWRAWHFDDEADDWRYMAFTTRDSALYELDGDAAEEGPADDGTRLDCVQGHVLTDAAMAQLERWHDPMDALYGAVILFAMSRPVDVAPDLVGVWWSEEHDPLSLSCPRGGILPGRLAGFTVRPGGPGQGWSEDGPSLS